MWYSVLFLCKNGWKTGLTVTSYVHCLSCSISVTISKEMYTECYKLHPAVQVTKAGITSWCEYIHKSHLAPTRMSYERKNFWRTEIVEKKSHVWQQKIDITTFKTWQWFDSKVDYRFWGVLSPCESAADISDEQVRRERVWARVKKKKKIPPPQG